VMGPDIPDEMLALWRPSIDSRLATAEKSVKRDRNFDLKYRAAGTGRNVGLGVGNAGLKAAEDRRTPQRKRDDGALRSRACLGVRRFSAAFGGGR